MSNPKVTVYPGGRLQVSGGTVQIGQPPAAPSASVPPGPTPKLWLDANNATFTDYYVSSWSNQVAGGEAITFVPSDPSVRYTHRGSLNGRTTVVFDGTPGANGGWTGYLQTVDAVSPATDSSCTLAIVMHRHLPPYNIGADFLGVGPDYVMVTDENYNMMLFTDTEFVGVKNDALQQRLMDRWCVVVLRPGRVSCVRGSHPGPPGGPRPPHRATTCNCGATASCSWSSTPTGRSATPPRRSGGIWVVTGT